MKGMKGDQNCPKLCPHGLWMIPMAHKASILYFATSKPIPWTLYSHVKGISGTESFSSVASMLEISV